MNQQINLQAELHRLSVNTADFPTGTSVAKYVKWLNELLEHRDERFLQEYLPIITENNNRDHSKDPFLTIITRTQGTRPEMLRETLLSLAAQSDTDFELILIGHKVSDIQDLELQTIIEEQPQYLQSRIRYLKLDHGNRTAPINFGFAHAYGQYVSILDDDDIVFDHYVEAFHNAATTASGSLLHAYVLDQAWKTLNTETGTALYAAWTPRARFCTDFHMVRQFETNFCPLMGIAFPVIYFHKYGMIFDESYTTTEDWDYLMRMASLVGVTNIPDPTAIYRIWENAENSAVVHNGQEWADNYIAISEKFRQMPVLIPQGMEKFYKQEPVQIPPVSLRALLKERLRQAIPNPIWKIAKTVYRILGGKKWLG